MRKFVRGRGELFKSTRSKKVRMANTIAEQMVREFTDRKAGLRGGRVTIAELCDSAFAQCEKRAAAVDEDGHPLRRARTLEHDRTYLKDKVREWKNAEGQVVKRREYPALLKVHFGTLFADEIDAQFWDYWVRSKGRLLGRNLNDYAKYLSLVLQHAVDEKWLPAKPELYNPTKHKKKAVIYSDEQVLAFFNAAEPELQDLIVVGSENPLRPHENAEVRWDWVEIRDGTVTYDLPPEFVKKGARKIQLTPNAAQVIMRRWEVRRALPPAERSPFVFPAPKDPRKPLSRKTLNRMWHRMKAAAGIPDAKIQFHWFRHNVFRRLTKVHGFAPAVVAQVGGTSAATIQKHYDLEEEQARVQVAGAISIPFKKVDGGS